MSRKMFKCKYCGKKCSTESLKCKRCNLLLSKYPDSFIDEAQMTQDQLSKLVNKLHNKNKYKRLKFKREVQKYDEENENKYLKYIIQKRRHMRVYYDGLKKEFPGSTIREAMKIRRERKQNDK